MSECDSAGCSRLLSLVARIGISGLLGIRSSPRWIDKHRLPLTLSLVLIELGCPLHHVGPGAGALAPVVRSRNVERSVEARPRGDWRWWLEADVVVSCWRSPSAYLSVLGGVSEAEGLDVVWEGQGSPVVGGVAVVGVVQVSWRG